MGARSRRRRRPAPRWSLRRWIRRRKRAAGRLAYPAVALVVLAAALAIPRLSRDRSESPEQVAVTPGAAPPQPRKGTPVAAVRPTRQLPERAAPAEKRGPPAAVPVTTPATPAAPAAEHAQPPRAAIVIDDLGQNIAHFEQLAALEIPLSIAVLPGLPDSDATVSAASRSGIELLLHQPMEPREERGKNPGRGALLTSMTAEAIRSRVRENIAAVPGAVGVNNHMGSRFTEDAAGLEAVLTEIGLHGLFWLDSRTTAATRGLEAARALGIPAIERDVFIDAEVDPAFIRRQLRKLVATARRRGSAVGIGHPHDETIRALREMRGELLASGVALVPVSALVREGGGRGRSLAAAADHGGRGGGAATGSGTP